MRVRSIRDKKIQPPENRNICEFSASYGSWARLRCVLSVESRTVESQRREHEAELARELVAGHPGAFDRFVDYFGTKVANYSFMMCGHREDAEEVAQETLLKVFERAEQIRQPDGVKAWVFRIARNECLMKRRRSVFAPERELSLDEFIPAKAGDGDSVRIEIADWSALPDAQALKAELNERLGLAIRALPEAYKSVLMLRDAEGLSTEETARILDVTDEAVRTRLHRARLAVRKSLDEYLRGVQGKGNRIDETRAH